jgi:hypothetical protein
MEPDDIPVHDLLDVGHEPEPGRDELRAIVSRAGRKRWAMAGVAATLALALGLGIGFGTANHSPPASQTAAGGAASGQNTASGQNATSGQNAISGAAPSIGAASGNSSGSAYYSNPIAPATTRFTRVFTRTAGDVTIRGFLVTFPPVMGLSAACQVGGSHLQVEVSTPKMVGIVGSGLVGTDRSQPLSGMSSEVVGTAEGDPTSVLIAATGSGVAKVTMSFAGGGTDSMAPVNGWVALAGPAGRALSYGSNLGTVSERNSAGRVVSSQAVHLGEQSSVAPASSCAPVCSNMRPQTGANAGSATASGVTASGSAPVGALCPPLPCSPVSQVLPPEKVPATSGSGTVTPGAASGSGTASTYTCAVPAVPPTGAGSSGSSGASR